MDRNIQKFMSDATEVRFAGDVGGKFSWQQTQNNAFANQTLGMKAQGTSYSNGQPKDLEGFVDQEIRKAAISNLARDFGWDEDITNAVVRGEWARQDQKKADHNTRKEAARSTAITAITTIATLGAGAAFGPALQTGLASVGKAFGASTAMAAKIGAQVVKTAIQVIDGSRNGAKGMLAGLANGVIGGLTIGGFEGIAAPASNFLQSTGLGLGISYDVKRDALGNKKSNWGGMLGIGGNNTNLSVSFLERGATTISGSYGVNDNINLTSSYNMGSGVTNVGATYGFDESSDYENFSLVGGYNFHTRPGGDTNPFFPDERERTGISGSVTYSPLTGQGNQPWNPSMTVGFNPNGLNASLSTDRVNLGSVTNNGYQAGNQNWVQENISAAQRNEGADGDKWLKGLISDGISGIQSGIGYVERTLNDLTGEYLTGAGNSIRDSAWGQQLPFLSNLIASPIDIATGGIKMGVESLTFPMQLAAYTGEFWRGERQIRLGDGIGTFGQGIRELPRAVDGAITAIGDLQMQIGDGLRNIPIVGGMLGYGADMFTGAIKAGAGVLTSPLRALYGPFEGNSYDAILTDLKSGFDRAYSGVSNTVDILGRDISAGWIGALSQVGKTGIDLANVLTLGTIDELGDFPKDDNGIENPNGKREASEFPEALERFGFGFVPNYGMYGGGNWGTSDWGNNPDLILNRFDAASLNHDMDMNEWKWLENTWSTSPSPHQWVGPIGAAYSILGSALFTPAAIVDGEVPFLPNYQDKEQQTQGTNK